MIKRLCVPVALAIAATALVLPVATAAPAPPSTVADVPPSFYEKPGPSAVTVVKGGPDHTLFYPTDLGAGGTQHPVLIWGNGTGVDTKPYDSALRHLASWGFVVAAANTKRSGSGKEMLAGARFMIEEDKRPGSVFEGKIDETKIGAAGHSQGGGGAINAGADPMVKTTIPLQPGPQGTVGALKGPALFVAGQVDVIVPSWFVRSRYSQAGHVPAVFAELKGSDHFFPGETRVRMVGVVTAWFRYWLSGDQQAKRIFFGPDYSLGADPAWSATARNAKAEQIAR
ncbi:hypothetical protein EV193_105346 [Herbihabitans rhizosphaerae]|uniref:PET hydrolase/cutinase-like domain-containing protein n=1 Tax=Herbihabitans rhizosphaerae TaxID=1872711 RepID=A0A4Q7KNA4_9PSEU|nr:acetylxylan esterase [Herbihabitans rhizosphaerae]RZS37787.1 hypothetical protein EV193_105346 [Herbihabitans rhizosphaerae]